MYREEARKLVSQLTLDEKASLTSGMDMFATQSIERLDIPSVKLADGPHGLRKQDGAQDFLGKNESKTAICFPAACATGSSFDPDLLYEMGQALGQACHSEDIDIILGPGINIKRSPLCGRNFEYFSEDPYVSGKLGTAYVKGVQSQGRGTSLKHFLANNQETRRRTSNSRPSERALREIYLPAFEMVVKEAKPWSVMAAYNKINGTYATENTDCLIDILQKEWGFDGLIVSDWAAVHDRIAALKAHCSLTMPSDTANDNLIIGAIQNGSLDEETLNTCCEDIVALALKAKDTRKSVAYDFEENHSLARRIAEESMVLLKNENNILPLDPQKNIVFIGPFATEPRFQGAGSSKVNAYRVSTMPEVTANLPNISYVQGFEMDDTTNETLLEEAIEAAASADIVIIMAGLPAIMESEGFDRWVMKLPKNQNHLIQTICQVQPNTVVVLENGGAVEMPWVEAPKAILEAYLSGEAANEAIWNVLTGVTNPSGHLAESFPLQYKDCPISLYWPGEEDIVDYPEGVFVGYRDYSTREAALCFPFGHGLSYTEFTYDDLTVERNTFSSGDTLKVSVTVKNVGARTGKALVQLYIGCKKHATPVNRPRRELRRFEKVELAPGESKNVQLIINDSSFTYWDETVHQYRIAGGEYEVEICRDAATVLLSEKIAVENQYVKTDMKFTLMSALSDIQKHPAGKSFLDQQIPAFMAIVAKSGMNTGKSTLPYADEAPKTMGLMSEPLQTLKRVLRHLPEETWDDLLQELNR